MSGQGWWSVRIHVSAGRYAWASRRARMREYSFGTDTGWATDERYLAIDLARWWRRAGYRAAILRRRGWEVAT
jgi:hypothetical protein